MNDVWDTNLCFRSIRALETFMSQNLIRRIELDYEYQTKSNVFFKTVLKKKGSYNLFIVLSKHSQETTLLLFLRLSIHEANEERISDTKEQV